MGKMEGRVELLRLEAGSLRIVSGELSRGGAAGKDNGADLPPVVVSVDRIDLSDLVRILQLLLLLLLLPSLPLSLAAEGF